MKTLYIECNMGAAGDMLMAALLELHPSPDTFISQMNGLGLPGVLVKREPSVKCGITGTHVQVSVNGAEESCTDIPAGHAHSHSHTGNTHHHAHEHDHAHEPHSHEPVGEHIHSGHGHGHSHGAAHSHTGLAEIRALVNTLPVSAQVKHDALAVYSLVAEAESKAHGRPVETVHFHEVGALDAVADIVGVCLLMEALAPQRVLASPVHVGSGQVKCAHGILPVPAPATAHILQGIPTYGGGVAGELCTPTGAALLKHFVHEFGSRPLMTTEAIGYGMGQKDFDAANCVRVFFGQSTEPPGKGDTIVQLACNLDDMTGEELGFALEQLLENGALDAFFLPLQMKKSRPGQMLVCLCAPQDEEKMAALMLRHTTSFGLRVTALRRYTLERDEETIHTAAGSIRVKTGYGPGIRKSKAEYEDLARTARERGLSLFEVKETLTQK